MNYQNIFLLTHIIPPPKFLSTRTTLQSHKSNYFVCYLIKTYLPLYLISFTMTVSLGAKYGFDGNVKVLRCMPRVYLPRKTRYIVRITGNNKKARVVANDSIFAVRKAA